MLDAGFTTICDAGGLVALHLKYAINEGTTIGPRIVAAGPFLSQTFGHGDTHYMPVEWVDVRITRKLTPLGALICEKSSTLCYERRRGFHQDYDYWWCIIREG